MNNLSTVYHPPKNVNTEQLIDGWKIYQINGIINNFIDFRGKTPLKIGMNWGGGEIPALSANNVEMGRINKDKETYYGSEKLYQKWMNKGDTEKGDILLTMEAPLGNVAQIPDDRKYILSQRVILLKTKKDIVFNEFLKHKFMSDDFQALLKSYSTGTTATGIQQSKLILLPVLIPSLKEQQKIAEIIDAIDKAISLTDTHITKLKKAKAGLLHDLLTRGIDDHGELRDYTRNPELFKRSLLGTIPKDWNVKTLEELTTKIVDGVHKKPAYKDSGIPFLTVENLTYGSGINFQNVRYISLADHNQFFKRADPKPGDVLVTKDGTLGIARIIPHNSPEFSIFVSLAQLRPNINLAFPSYILTFFETGEYACQLGHRSAGTGLKHIHLEHFRAFQIATPPLSRSARKNQTM